MQTDLIEEKAESVNKKKFAYDLLKKRIVNNELKPLEYLNERSLSQTLKISKTPIREAIQQLELNRFIVVVPNKGCFVSNISVEDIRAIFEIREIYECAAARIAAVRADVMQFIDLRNKKEIFDSGNVNDARNYLLTGDQIHTRIIESVGNTFLFDSYRTVLDHIIRIRVYFINRFGMKRLEETDQEHKNIVDAIVARDADGAETAMRMHLQNAFAYIKRLI
jgi:DNA-binding GntR family transcriptional regulator